MTSPSQASSSTTSQTSSPPPVVVVEKRYTFFTPEVTSYFIAGGCAGAASRTVVSPLERLKIIQQVQPRSGNQQYKGVWRSLVRLVLACWSTRPMQFLLGSAVQFTTYEQLKKWFTQHGSKELDTPKRLASGALAGITSVCSTYPLDLVRSRLSIATASLQAVPQTGSSTITASASGALASAYHTSAPSAYTKSELTIWGMTLKIMREEGGVRGLYRGLVTTAVGVAPYVGINFAAYELLRGILTPPGKSNVVRKLACGALAGSISQTLTYPFDVLRRKMQVTGMASNSLGIKYNGALDALAGIIRTEGVKGLYRGLWPNLLKVAPSIATSFFTYELASPHSTPVLAIRLTIVRTYIG
ncbi:hypothetical protein ONZ45_g12879 [Pleurotus djamor]|nr:hypothetical protein ONZ45_g12879 [Pleurotus djamor]